MANRSGGMESKESRSKKDYDIQQMVDRLSIEPNKTEQTHANQPPPHVAGGQPHVAGSQPHVAGARQEDDCQERCSDLNHSETGGKLDKVKKPRRSDMAAPSWEVKDLQNERSFHWSKSEPQAAKLLKESEHEKCYLTRYSKRDDMFYLSVMWRGRNNRSSYKHYEIIITRDKASGENSYAIRGDDEKKFAKVSEMLEHYQASSINRDGNTIGLPVVPSLDSHASTENDTSLEVAREETTGALQKHVTDDPEVPHTDETDSSLDTTAEMKKTTENAMQYPSLSSLKCITWKTTINESNLRIIEAVKSDWESIGTTLGLSREKLQEFREKGNDDTRCLLVFEHWIRQGGYGQYPVTWEGLLRFLKSEKYPEIAITLNTALNNLCW